MAKIIIPGGSGYCGRILCGYLSDKGHEVVVLSRSETPVPGARVVQWDGETLGEWAEEVDGADAVVNLAGRTVNCRYHQANRKQIYDSRLRSTEVVGDAITQSTTPPRTWLNMSTATIYRHAEDRAMDEETGEILEDAGMPGAEKWAFSVDVAKRWEEVCEVAEVPQTRKVLLRTAMVFGGGAGGVFEAFRMIVQLRLGGTLGSGRQYVSWIHSEDFCRAIEHLLFDSDLKGAVNLASPHPLTNRRMMRELRDVFGVKIGLPAMDWMLEIGAWFLRTETELLLKSRRVVPQKLLNDGFHFRYPDFREAAAKIKVY